MFHSTKHVFDSAEIIDLFSIEKRLKIKIFNVRQLLAEKCFFPFVVLVGLMFIVFF